MNPEQVEQMLLDTARAMWTGGYHTAAIESVEQGLPMLPNSTRLLSTLGQYRLANERYALAAHALTLSICLGERDGQVFEQCAIACAQAHAFAFAAAIALTYHNQKPSPISQECYLAHFNAKYAESTAQRIAVLVTCMKTAHGSQLGNALLELAQLATQERLFTLAADLVHRAGGYATTTTSLVALREVYAADDDHPMVLAIERALSLATGAGATDQLLFLGSNRLA